MFYVFLHVNEINSKKNNEPKYAKYGKVALWSLAAAHHRVKTNEVVGGKLPWLKSFGCSGSLG